MKVIDVKSKLPISMASIDFGAKKPILTNKQGTATIENKCNEIIVKKLGYNEKKIRINKRDNLVVEMYKPAYASDIPDTPPDTTPTIPIKPDTTDVPDEQPIIKKRLITFAFYAPNAKTVHICGTFNNWDETSHLMTKTDSGDWVIKLNLAAGRYIYKFFVDSTSWQLDSNTMYVDNDGRGGLGSVLIIKGF